MSDIGGTRGSDAAQRIKILFCIPDMIIGGVETVFLKTLENIAATGCADIAVVMKNKLREPFYIEWFRAHPEIKLHIIYPAAHRFEDAKKYMRGFPLKNIRKIAFSVYKDIKNAQVARKKLFEGYDVIIDYKNAYFSKLLRKCTTPKITWIHGSINFFENDNILKHAARYEKIVCLSDNFMTEFRRRHPEHADKIVRIYNPFDAEQIRRAAANGDTYVGKYFCVVSRLDPDKDIKTIIDAFEIFHENDQFKDVRLLIIGTGRDAKKLREYAAQQKSRHAIVFAGKIPAPFGYMRGAIAHILSSHNEGLPTVLIEAASLGVANISSDCPSGPREILLNGDAGLLFDIGNARQLAQHMTNICSGKTDTRKMTDTATAALDRFDAKEITNQIMRLIHETTGGKSCR